MNLPANTGLTFEDILRQADVLAQSQIIPRSYQRRGPDIVAAGLAGQAFGWDVMTSLRNYHVIEGTATLRPEAMLGLVRRAGHSVTIKMMHDDHEGRMATVIGRRHDTGDQHVAVFSEADAKKAGLAGKKNWQQYLDAMLTWRAVAQLCRLLFPDVVLGAGYVPEEIGAEVDSSGDPFAPNRVSVAEAKRRVLEACDGDKDRARLEWPAFHDRFGDDITDEQVEAFCYSLRTPAIGTGQNEEEWEEYVIDDAAPPAGEDV